MRQDWFSENDINELTRILERKEEKRIVYTPQMRGLWLHDVSWETEIRLLVLPGIRLIVSRVCFQKQRAGTMTEILDWMKNYCRKTELSQICVQSVETEAMSAFCFKHGFTPDPVASMKMRDGLVIGDFKLNI
jgi:hypothetical protein